MSSPVQLLFPSMDPDSASVSSPVSPVTHLPFRRISLPTAPNLNLNSNRQSVVSLASFESLPERGAPQSMIASPTRKVKSRRPSIEAHRRGVRRRGHQPHDKERDAKRSKVIQEFYDTERTYVQGLDLIYEVSLTLLELVELLCSLTMGDPLSYFLLPLSLHSIHHTLSWIVRISPPYSPTSLTFGIFIAHSFLLSMRIFIPPFLLALPHNCSQVLHHICPLFSCRIFRICHCIHHLLPRSARPWLL
jgi:hypothetical protein